MPFTLISFLLNFDKKLILTFVDCMSHCVKRTLSVRVQESNVSKAVKSLVTLSTLLLCFLIVVYHAIEVQVRPHLLTYLLTY